MDSKQVQGMMEAYASIYEKKGDCVDKKDKGAHNCAKKVCHEQYGEGETIFGQHAVPDENGFVSHYDVQFEHGIVENVSVEEMKVLTMEGHPTAEGHRYEGEMIDENSLQDTVDKITKGAQSAVEKLGVPINRTKRGTRTKADQKGKIENNVNENLDTFDVIKGHLIDEGYADTEESALAIMTNMSEEWRQSIIEAVGIVGPPKKSIDKIPGVRNARIGLANAVKRLDYGYNDEIKKVGKHVVPTPRYDKKPGGTEYKDISGDK